VDSAIRLESSSKRSEEVSKDPGAIGFIDLPYISNSKAIAISTSADTSSIFPTRFTVSTEDYPLSRHLYLYAPSIAAPMVKDFMHFVASHAGQEIVEQVGLISQNIKQEQMHKIKNAPQSYNDYTETAKRLSVNFHFKSGSNQLDKLFTSFDAQPFAVVQRNVKQTINLLDSSGHQLLFFMQNKNIELDEFLADRCLPLIHFYLAPNQVQQQIFLSPEKLGKLFAEIPTIEAYLFKNAVTLAVQKVQAKQKEYKYLDCFYQIQEGNVQILDGLPGSQQFSLIYSELSPLQQLQAQKLCKKKSERISA
jgi:hypothetical protein